MRSRADRIGYGGRGKRTGAQRGRDRYVVAALLAAALPWAGIARAQGSDVRGFGLSGDWGGVRSRLKDAGWTFRINETIQSAADLSRSDLPATAAAQLTLGATADMRRIAGIAGGELKMSITRRNGNSLTNAAGLDLEQNLLSIHGRGNIWRLTEFYWEQDLAGGALGLKLGRVNPGADFAVFPCDFQNLTFCGAQPGNLVGGYWQNAPVSQWGGRLKLNRDRGAGYFSVGAYRVNQDNVERGFALNFGGQGMLYPVEAGWTPKLGAQRRPGEYRLTAWYSTVDGEDVYSAATRHGRYGASLLMKQQVTGQPAGPALALFLRLTQADRRTARLDRQITVGAEWRGAFASRPDDVLALALGTTNVNSRASEPANAPHAARESVAELDYRMKLRKDVTFTPNLQYVHRTGGRNLSDVLAVGLQVSLGF